MKKLLISLASAITLALGLLSSNAQVWQYPYTASVTVPPGGMSNLVANPCRVSQMVITATTSTNATGLVLDSVIPALSTNTLAYTNTISYGTNLIWGYTNYFGVITSLTNFALVDVTNNVVPTNVFYYPSMPVAAIGNSSSTIANLNQTFVRGIEVTNGGVGNLNVTVSYVLQ